MNHRVSGSATSLILPPLGECILPRMGEFVHPPLIFFLEFNKSQYPDSPNRFYKLHIFGRNVSNVRVEWRIVNLSYVRLAAW
jgi:hypothetical protein